MLKVSNDIMVKPKISIFVPTGNRALTLEKVLDSLSKQTYKNFEVIIVDYKSTDETPDVINEYKDKLSIKIIHQIEKGLSKAANLALDVAQGDIFIRTDDDVVMDEGWLDAVNNTFKKYPKAGGVTGPTVVPKKNLISRNLFYFERQFRKGNIFLRFLGYIYFNYFMEGKPYAVSQWFKCGAFSLGSNYEGSLKEPIQEINNLEACNFSVKTKLLKKVGGFDSIYTGVGEYHEADAAFKIQKLGYKLMFNPKAIVNHCPSQDGFFNDRTNSYSRMINFIIFHSRFLKVNNLDTFFRYSLYLIFLNSFYIYLAITRHQAIQLMAIPGTIAGLFQITFDKKLTQYAKS